MKRLIFFILALFLTVGDTNAASKAQIFQTLLSGVRSGGVVLGGGKIYAYEPGTTTKRAIYLDRNKTSPALNPYTLDPNGQAELFFDGVYDIKINNAAGSVKAYWETVALVDVATGGGGGGGSMTWPNTAGIANYDGSEGWSNSYNAANPIPFNFLDGVAPISHNQAAETITTGTLDGDRLPVPGAKKGGVTSADMAAKEPADSTIIKESELSSSTSSTSTTTAANSAAVKAAYDLANGKQPVHASLTSIAGLTETNGGIPYGTADNTYAWLAAGTSNYLLQGNGAGAPSWTNAPTVSAINMTNFPTLNQNTSGTAANVFGTPALPNGTTATTQTAGDNSTKLATTAYVATAVSGGSVDDTAYDATTWNGVTTTAPSKNAVRDILEAKLPSGSDGTYGLILTNNTTRSPTAATDEIYPEGDIFKVNQNGTESSVAIGPTAGQVTFTGPTATRSYALPDSTATVLTDNAVVTGAQGGTGVSNSGKTITLGGNLATSGAFALTATLTGTTGVTFPTSGTLATTAGNIATATALAADPADCSANNFATAINASGTLTCAQPSISAGVSGLGTGIATALAVNVGTAGAPVVNGGALGTPSSGTLTSATGLPIAGLVASTSTAIGVGSIELGAASDTTIARSAAAKITVEGNPVAYDATLTGVHATPSTTNPLSPTWTGVMHTVWYGATGTINLPAAATYAGRGILIYNTGAFTVTVDANASEVIVRDGTVQTGGVSMTLSSGAGNYVALLCDGARWVTLGFKGTLAAGS